ncbi:MAG: asparagine--tRNA ligase [Deltaproteobacteria bacterium]|nr:MAG: asparagine--tRNA ligase [Deltaproteobacteria bacterium]
MKRIKVKHLLTATETRDPVTFSGWVRTRRTSKDFSFIEINDGSCLANIQVVADAGIDGYDDVSRLTTGSAVTVTGKRVPSPGKGQKWEVQAVSITTLHVAPEDFPLQKKRHTDEFLRTIAHLRPRTNKYGAAFRIRSELAKAVHTYFWEQGFQYIHTPIITGSDCEGAGELFRITTLPVNHTPENKKDAFSEDFFGKEAHLTVSGQLNAEMFALALGDVYTFGPTFRAENSHTARHAAEFWMIEPEMAFCDLIGNMDLAEDMVKYLTHHVLNQCTDDLNLFASFVDKTLRPGLERLCETAFERLPYTEAVKILQSAKQDFVYPPAFGEDLQTEHERFLTDVHFKKPVIVYDYPRSIKPFYMRCNDDGETVAAMDLLVPRIGELVGGSQREERLAVLEARMDEAGLDKAEYQWYIDSRKYGSVPHSGFGMGFERLVMMMSGITNIRDVIPFPRTPGSIGF